MEESLEGLERPIVRPVGQSRGHWRVVQITLQGPMAGLGSSTPLQVMSFCVQCCAIPLLSKFTMPSVKHQNETQSLLRVTAPQLLFFVPKAAACISFTAVPRGWKEQDRHRVTISYALRPTIGVGRLAKTIFLRIRVRIA